MKDKKNNQRLVQGISDFKKGYQPRTNIVQGEKGDLVIVLHSVSALWRKFFSQLFVEHWFSDVRETEIHTAEPLVLDLRALEFHMLIENLKAQISWYGSKRSRIDYCRK